MAAADLAAIEHGDPQAGLGQRRGIDQGQATPSDDDVEPIVRREGPIFARSGAAGPVAVASPGARPRPALGQAALDLQDVSQRCFPIGQRRKCGPGAGIAPRHSRPQEVLRQQSSQTRRIRCRRAAECRVVGLGAPLRTLRSAAANPAPALICGQAGRREPAACFGWLARRGDRLRCRHECRGQSGGLPRPSQPEMSPSRSLSIAAAMPCW